MKIEMIEDYRHGRDLLAKEEVRVVDDGLGKVLCQMGFAKDLSGAVETGEKDVNKTVILDVDNAEQATLAEKANG